MALTHCILTRLGASLGKASGACALEPADGLLLFFFTTDLFYDPVRPQDARYDELSRSRPVRPLRDGFSDDLRCTAHSSL